MPLTRRHHNGASPDAGYKFDLYDEATGTEVKIFVTRDAVMQAITMLGCERSLEDVLDAAASKKFDKRTIEDDGLVLIETEDL
jgi:hypothetical protein